MKSDDPKLVAFALRQLPVEEAAEIQELLLKSPELRAEVEAIRDTAAQLRAHFKSESNLSLLGEQHETVTNAVSGDAHAAQGSKVIHLKTSVLLQWAAAFVISAVLVALLVPRNRTKTSNLQSAVQLARNEPQRPPPSTIVAIKPATEWSIRDHETPPSTLQEPGAQTRVIPNQVPAAPANAEKSTAPISPIPPKTEVPSAVVLHSPENPDPKSFSIKSSMVSQSSVSDSLSFPAQKPGAPDVARGRRGGANLNSGGGGGGGFGGNGGSGGVAFEGGGSRGGRLQISGNNIYRSYAMETESRFKSSSLQDNPDDGFTISPLRYGSPTDTASRTRNTAEYPSYPEMPFQLVANQPLTTFSIDVDTASYANIRRFLREGQMPPPDAVRVEEMLNYFHYDYPAPKNSAVLATFFETAECPWDPSHQLVRIALRARDVKNGRAPVGNFVFLIDISGSMRPENRLPLIKQSLRFLVRKMASTDRVAIVTYASNSGIRLESTPCSDRQRILDAIDSLEAGGSTNGGEGIQQAYRVASDHYIEEGNNRVLLCTDGDFNVGITDHSELLKLIEQKARSGVFLTTLGVGNDNLKDALMQKMADRGNGNYHYLDTIEEGQKVLVDQMNATLTTVAKDVKLQVEFNPAEVSAYRLIGYEKRALQNRDFANDLKDAGDLGAGQTVTAFYELIPSGVEALPSLKYQPRRENPAPITGKHEELLTVKVRFKEPEGSVSRELEFPANKNRAEFAEASADFRFAAAVAAFGLHLKHAERSQNLPLGTIRDMALKSKGSDSDGYRSEFISLVEAADNLQRSGRFYPGVAR